MNRKIKKILIILSVILVMGLVTVFTINSYVKISTKDKIISIEEIANDQDCIILVLGAGLWSDKPSPILKDRLEVAIKLYNAGVAKKIIMSGDHTKDDYDEVNVMKSYAVDAGIPSSDIFMDHAGISTYDSIYRAKNIFNLDEVIIVTQEFHLYRSLYIAKKLGLDAKGVSATLRDYSGEVGFEIREILARDKDFVKTLFKPESKYLGDEISVFGDGDITNDK